MKRWEHAINLADASKESHDVYIWSASYKFKFVLESRGRVLNEEYVQRLQKLMYLHLFTDCFMKISLRLSNCEFQ